MRDSKNKSGIFGRGKASGYICPCTWRYIEKIVNDCFLREFSLGVTIIRQNDMVDFLYVPIKGNVEVSAAVNSRETIPDIIEPIGFFILAADLGTGTCMQSARILTDSLILMILAERIRNPVKDDSYFMRTVAGDLLH